MSPRRRSAFVPRAAVAALATGLLVPLLTPLLAGCSQEEGRSAERYCGVVGERLSELVDPVIVTEADIEATLELYREMARRAPAAVEPEWQTLVANLETAATVVPTDPDSVQRAADTARAATPAAVRVQEYTSSTCGLQLGPVASPTLPPTTIEE